MPEKKISANRPSHSPAARKRSRFRGMSKVTSYHYFRLCYRSVLFLSAFVWYIRLRMEDSVISIRDMGTYPIQTVLWCVFMLEMIMRFFPSTLESPGAQKQFHKNYKPTGRTDIQIHDNNATMIVTFIWLIMNGLIGWTYMLNLIDEGILLLICLAYSVCDMVCILFFCPIQLWFLKNRCCSSCRIYNWDYAMMFTPFFFIPGIYTWSLLMAAVVLLFRWEITFWKFPERFSENTNEYLSCKYCNEKLCLHKRQLLTFRQELKFLAEKQIRRILSGKNE